MRAIAFLIIGIALSGCGMDDVRGFQSFQSLGQWNDGNEGAPSYGTSDVDPSYFCPDSANVKPDPNVRNDGVGNFKVCRHKDDANQLLIHGTTAFSNTICVIPVQHDQTGQQTWIDLFTGELRHQCASPQALGVYVTFPKQDAQDEFKFNAVVIVESPFYNQMEYCLDPDGPFQPGGPNINLCPGYANWYNGSYYSYGKIK